MSDLCIAVVAYEAAAFIEGVLDRIPDTIGGRRPTILVADDCSTDDTADRARAWAAAHVDRDVVVVRHDVNLGYGGNQKACYRWARERGCEVVVLLHGDGQYPPEQIGDLVAPLDAGEADAVFGSRMTEPSSARRGGMPMTRYVGNRSISWCLNHLVGSSLAEWFSGFRAYRVADLVGPEIEALPDGFDFDTWIMFDLYRRGVVLLEVPIPTRYADEVSRVPLVRTGWSGLRGGVRHYWSTRGKPRRGAGADAAPRVSG